MQRKRMQEAGDAEWRVRRKGNPIAKTRADVRRW